MRRLEWIIIGFLLAACCLLAACGLVPGGQTTSDPAADVESVLPDSTHAIPETAPTEPSAPETEAPDPWLGRSVTDDVVVAVNGTPLPDCLSCDGTPFLTASALASVTGGNDTASSDSGGKTLTLRARDHVLCFTEGAENAVFDAQSVPLPIPARQEGGNWYLPAECTGRALGFTAVSDDGQNRLDLLRFDDGAPCWFGGTGFGRCKTVGDTPCGDLAALSAAVGAALQEDGGTVRVTVMDRTLTFTSGSVLAAADEEQILLPVPAVKTETGWLVPLRPLADFFGLEERSEENCEQLIFSDVNPTATVLWVNGTKQSSCFERGGVRCVELSEAAACLGGSFHPDGNTALLSVCGKSVALTGGSPIVKLGGEALSMSAPAAADGDTWYAPASDLLQAVGLSELEDPAWNQAFYTRIVRNDEIAEGYRVPVLMYHAVSDYLWGIPELFVSPANMEAQLRALVDGGYTAVTFEDLDHIESIEKPVMLTFDDGYRDAYEELFPLLKKYNVKVTVFVIIDAIGNIRSLTKEQIKELSDSGLVSIQSHTMSHGYLDEMNADRLLLETRDSVLALARITGKQPFVLCYPTGKNSALSRYYTAEYYQFGLCMGGPCYVTGSAPYRIYRYYISRYTPLETFLADLG